MKAENEPRKNNMVILRHGTVCSDFIVEFGATAWITPIAYSGGCGAWGKHVRVKDTPVMKVEMLVENMVSNVPK